MSVKQNNETPLVFAFVVDVVIVSDVVNIDIDVIDNVVVSVVIVLLVMVVVDLLVVDVVHVVVVVLSVSPSVSNFMALTVAGSPNSFVFHIPHC